MKINVSELTSHALDYAAAMAAGYGDERHAIFIRGNPGDIIGVGVKNIGGLPWDTFSPTTDWKQAGAIIERESIFPTMLDNSTPDSPLYQAAKFDWKGYWRMRCIEYGPTPLIAAMRCYVTEKLGAAVEIPDELAAALKEASATTPSIPRMKP